MRLDGRRESNNIEDRRRTGRGVKASIEGLRAIIVIALITLMSGGNLGDAIGNIAQQGALNGLQEECTLQQREFTAGEGELVKFSGQIPTGTESVRIRASQQMGRKYAPPALVLHTGGVWNACGSAISTVGSSYCSGDQKLHLDLSFFATTRRQSGASGDFAYAYVIVYEVGHHVEHLPGTLSGGHSMMSCMSKVKANRASVRLEFLADCYAGMWAHHDDAEYSSLEDGNIEEVISCAEKIGNNYLQGKAQRYSQPKLFTHGTSARHMRWLKIGIEKDDMSTNTFDVNGSDLQMGS